MEIDSLVDAPVDRVLMANTFHGAPDHAALYALLSRLRDLAVPLLSVRVLDAEAQRRLYRQRRRNDTMIGAMVRSSNFSTMKP